MTRETGTRKSRGVWARTRTARCYGAGEKPGVYRSPHVYRYCPAEVWETTSARQGTSVSEIGARSQSPTTSN